MRYTWWGELAVEKNVNVRQHLNVGVLFFLLVGTKASRNAHKKLYNGR